MCGIIGYAGRHDDSVSMLLTGLSKLEYRGYDSTGLAVGDADIRVIKREGDLDALKQTVQEKTSLGGTVGVGHTRWSTHGEPSKRNAHPHTDCEKRVAIVHNGIIENYHALRDELEALGHEFDSETDTEVIPHLIGQYLDKGLSPDAAFQHAVEKLDGSYAIAAIFEATDRVIAARRDSSLVLGVNDNATFLASDVTALLEHTNTVVHLEDDEIAVLTNDDFTVYDVDGTPKTKTATTIEWDSQETVKGRYDHFMHKEIDEQATALRDCLRDRFTADERSVSLDDVDDLDHVGGVHLVACGTSYHAALYGAKVLRKRGIPAQAFLASEYAIHAAPIRDDTLVVGVTQSGETADTLSALRKADELGARTLAMTNVVGSTAVRECDDALFIRSGPEISVAATKTFAGQLVALNLLAIKLAQDDLDGELRSRMSALRSLPNQVQRVLDQSDAERVARKFADSDSFFFIGRGVEYPVALEGALKLKEITYEHAEGFAAGELKHGPLALVTEDTPVFVSVVGDDETARKTVVNAKEVKARDAPLIAVTDGASDISRYADDVLTIPMTDPETAPLLVNVQYQLLAYHVAKQLGRNIDKPRNLAKSVTVE